MGPAGAHRAAGHHGIRIFMGPERLGLRQQLLRGRRAGGHEELEGVLLRLDRFIELHHRRQAAGIAVGHGAFGADLRLLELEHARTPSPGRCRLSRDPLRDGQALVRRAGRPAGRRGLGVDTRGGADVPLQQPRRAARAASRRERLHPHPCAREGRNPLARGHRSAARFCLLGQDDAGLHRGSGVLLRVPSRGAHVAGSAHQAARGVHRGPGRGRRLVGDDSRALAGRVAADDRWLARQQHLEPDLRLQRIRPAREQRCGRKWRRIQRSDRRLPAVQRPYGWPSIMAVARRAARARDGVGRALAGRRAPIVRGRRSCCGAGGWS